jgi:AcrR family transcriptional regulator
MAWDTERTKRALLAAAVEDFADHGLAGARIDRIAAAAGVNKERIYQYFGNKSALFDAVLLAELERLADAVPLQAASPADLVDYAGAVFDHYQRRPHLARLLHWEGLELGQVREMTQPSREQLYRDKVAVISQALPAGTGPHPHAGDVLLTIIALVTAWHVLPQLHHMILGAEAANVRQRRNALIATVQKLMRP